MSKVNGPANVELARNIKYWNGFNVPVQWFYATDGRSAIGIGDGFVWALRDDNSINEAPLGDWETGVTI